MSASLAAHVYRISNWYGEVTDGISVNEFAGSSDPGVIFPSWGAGGALTIACRFGIGPGGGASVSGTTYPAGYTGGTSTFGNHTADAALETAYRKTVEGVENPSTFGGTFSGWNEIHALAISVRGYNGDPPAESGVETVQLDDTDSQDDHNAISTHQDPSNLFADSTEATTYGNLVLSTYATDRPILSLSFVASKSPAYRAQAILRRVGDMITVVANNNSGLGISADFFIESINHRWSKGTKLWEVTWELSPA